MHSGVELSTESFEVFFQTIRPLCFSVERKGPVVLNESDVPITAEIQSNYIARMMSFEQADGFIWMTGDTGRRLTEIVKSKVTAEPGNESASFVLSILAGDQFAEKDCIFSVELQPESWPSAFAGHAIELPPPPGLGREGC